jgi:hypothetical protein
MRSRVHPKYKTKYRVNNWAEYDQTLVQRGDITLWISKDAISSWKPAPTGLRGGQKKFSDHAIETALTLRLAFNLPLRQAEGFLRSVLFLMEADLEAPDHATLSRRSQSLNVDLHRVVGDKPIHLIVDSTGLSIVGEVEVSARNGVSQADSQPVQMASVQVDLSAFDESEKAKLREVARKAITGGGGADSFPSKVVPELTEKAR